MANTLEEVGATIQELVNRSLREQIRAAQRYNQWVQQSSPANLVDRSTPSNYLKFLTEEATNYTRSVAKLTFDYYNNLLKLGTAYSDTFFDRVANVRAAGPEDMRDETGLTRVQVELSAPVGTHATRKFILENKRPAATDIEFLVSEFRNTDTSQRFNPKLQFQPERFSLAADEERIVELDLDLDPQLFIPEQQYTATVLVTGSDVVLSLRVTPTTNPPEAL